MSSRRKSAVATKLSDLGPDTQLWFLAVAHFDISQAHYALSTRRQLRDAESPDKILMHAWGELAVVRYMRPFLQCCTPTHRKSTCIPAEILGIYDDSETAVHARTKTLRNKVAAHSDMSGTQVSMFAELELGESFEQGVLNLGTYVEQPTLSEGDFDALEHMAKKIGDKLYERIAAFATNSGGPNPILVGLGLRPPLNPSPED